MVINRIYFFKKITIAIVILFFMLFSQSCSMNKAGEPAQPATKEFRLVDKWVKKNLESCSILFFPEKNNKGKVYKIMRCISDFSISKSYPSDFSKTIKNKISSQRIDSYLPQKISFYIAKQKLSNSQLTTLLQFVANAPYGENAGLIKLFIQKGADTQNITVQRNLTSSDESTCKSSLAIVKKNAELYKNKNLDKPALDIHIHLTKDGYKKKIHGKIYRKNVLLHLHNDPAAYVHCRDPVLLDKLIKTIIHINPHLRNAVDSTTGRTPLHYYLRYFPDSVLQGKWLITKNNINKKDKRGWTPLHTLLISQSLNHSAEFVAMIKVLIDTGTNVDIRSKDGLTARELILKRSDLKSLLLKGQTTHRIPI